MTSRYAQIRAEFDEMAHDLTARAFMLSPEERAVRVQQITRLLAVLAAQVEGAVDEIVVLNSIDTAARRAWRAIRAIEQCE